MPAFQPGQHVGVTAEARGLSRFYSLVSPGLPGATYLRIAVQRAPKAVAGMSDFLHGETRIGDRLMVEAPKGCFVMPLSTRRPVVGIAGGVGVTPFLWYFRAFAASAVRQSRVTLHHAARTLADAPFHEELTALATQVPGLDYHLHLSRVNPCQPRTAWIDDAITAAFDRAPSRPLFYLCGSTSLVAAAMERLDALGAEPGDVQREIFENPASPSGPFRDAVITLARRRTSFQWTASNGSILEAALSARLALPSGCRVGQCESCAVRVPLRHDGQRGGTSPGA